MAKLKGPLFSFSASGKLADSLVFAKWKGINDVRQHVIPANPKTAAQQTQRGYMTSVVDKWHTTGFIALDIVAWNLYASTLAKVMSGFNAFVQSAIAGLKAGLPYNAPYNCGIAAIGAAGATVTIDTVQATEVSLWYGTKKSTLLTEQTGAFVGGTWTYTLAGLSASTEYFFYVKSTSGITKGRTGIYTFKTTA